MLLCVLECILSSGVVFISDCNIPSHFICQYILNGAGKNYHMPWLSHLKYCLLREAIRRVSLIYFDYLYISSSLELSKI